MSAEDSGNRVSWDPPAFGWAGPVACPRVKEVGMSKLSDEAIVRVAGWFNSGRVHWRMKCAALMVACEQVEARNGEAGLWLFLDSLER